MSKHEVDISGLDKKEVLRQLWLGSQPAIVFMASGVDPPDYDPKEAEKEIESIYVDYLCGRAIKTGVSTDKLDNSTYDRYNGEGAMQKAVDLVRKKKETTNQEIPKSVISQESKSCTID